MKILRLHFEDQGQDFLTWDVDLDGRVLEAQPFQASIWAKCTVQNIDEIMCENQKFVIYSAPFLMPGEWREIAYKITEVEYLEIESTDN